MSNVNIVTGTRFGRWTVLEKHEGMGRRRWICRCGCGTTRSVIETHLLSGASVSCGCYRTEIATKHGLHSHRLYRIWRHMIGRCYNDKNESYCYYGARGIKVCDRWHNLDSFYLDTIDHYEAHASKHDEENTSIDRIDVDRDYEPTNVRWTTASIQARNRRVPRNNKSGVSGVYKSNKGIGWVATITIKGDRKYLGTHPSLEEAAQARIEAEELYWNEREAT